MMKFRNIPSPIYMHKYVVDELLYSKTKCTLTINLWHAITLESFRARISFKNAPAMRITPLNACESEYCEQIGNFFTENPEEKDNFRGIVEIIGVDEFINRTMWPDCKHYLIITENEYVEVLSQDDPVVERTY